MNPRQLIFSGSLLGFFGVAHGAPDYATKGFVVTSFTPAVYADDAQCPEGLNKGPDVEAVLGKLPAAERARLRRPENSTEMLWKIRRRGSMADQCAGKGVLGSDPAFKSVQGPRANGLNLDGSDGKSPPINACVHDNFVGLNGETGVDNQWYRAIGCIAAYRPGGVMHQYFNTGLGKGEFGILIEIDGLDDVKNDEQIRVGFYRPAATRESAKAVSREVYYDKYFHAVTRGRIVDGVLTTDPVDMRFSAMQEMRDVEIRDARVRMEFQPDGKLKGILGGYQEGSVLYTFATMAADSELARGPMTCPGLAGAIRQFADGYPDPKKDGPCTWLSTAYEVEAAPAQIVNPYKTAFSDDGTAKQPAWWEKLLWWRNE